MKTILLIEDEDALQKDLALVLGEEGYKVISATDGEKGLKLARKQRPDLILLDVILPKMNGFEVLKGLKEDERTREIEVMVLTNLEDAGDADRALELGAKAYLTKTNYTLAEVVERVRQALK